MPESSFVAQHKNLARSQEPVAALCSMTGMPEHMLCLATQMDKISRLRQRMNDGIFHQSSFRIVQEGVLDGERRRDGEKTESSKQKIDENALVECLKCTICLEVLNSPVTLPTCGHSFCRACADAWPTFCALCRKPHRGRPAVPAYLLVSLIEKLRIKSQAH
ncbi:hypothetical protein M422DRAFT_44408 [Sphaerobolus stellatus SS14]|nr:hypothetical protein M422DRAFT_44408 [Sphaerobolus stellatus SS14]